MAGELVEQRESVLGGAEQWELFSGHGRQKRGAARGSCRLREPGHGPASPFSRPLVFLSSLPLKFFPVK